MNWEAWKPLATLIFTSTLKFAGGLLVAHGLATNGPGLEALSGAATTAAGAFWSWWVQKGHVQAADYLKKLTDTATTAAAVAVAKKMAPAAVTGAATDARQKVAADTGTTVPKAPIIMFAAAIALSALVAGGAHAQGGARAAGARAPINIAPDASADASSSQGLPTLTSYLPRPHLLKIPNPLQLPDPMCITDHPSANCPAGTEVGGGVKMTGNPKQDIADFIKRGGITFVRDMLRADQFLSYPCTPTSPVSCVKTDMLSSACIQVIVPIAKLIVNGPPDGTSQSTAATPSPTPTPLASASPSPSSSGPKMLNGLPAVDGTSGALLSTDSPPITSADDGVVTAAAKLDVIVIALQGPSLKLGCGGWVQDKLAKGTDLVTGVMTFITTLGVAGA